MKLLKAFGIGALKVSHFPNLPQTSDQNSHSLPTVFRRLMKTRAFQPSTLFYLLFRMHVSDLAKPFGSKNYCQSGNLADRQRS
eukprot:5987118-Amphidinium_carterae.1